jgi:glycosidase
MQFTSNHDENSWNGTEKERMGEARFALAVLSATLQGMPLIYNGQETSLDKRLRFFEKDTIDWSKMNLVSFYSKLMKLHQSNEALWNGPYGGDVQFISNDNDPNVLAFIRIKNDRKVLCVFNLANSKSIITLNGGQIAGRYSDLFSSKRKKIKDGTKIKLGPWEYRVFHL